ncbi:Uncharacterised protein [Achromobacter xylosoxidans]|nr:Uncharacterised protein [Achromobacter xylosoxidans]
MLDVGVGHCVGHAAPADAPVLHFGALRQVQVLDLEAGGHAVHQQAIRDVLVGAGLDPHHQHVAGLQRAAIPRLAVGTIPAALELDHVVARRGHRGRAALDVVLDEERLAAGVEQLRAGQLGRAQRHGAVGPAAFQLLAHAVDGQRGLPRGRLVAAGGARGQQQGHLFLRRQVRTVAHARGQLRHQVLDAVVAQLVLVGQRVRQRVVAHGAAVVAEPVVVVAVGAAGDAVFARHGQVERALHAPFVAHQLERGGQLDQGQRRTRAVLVVVEQLAHRRQRRLLVTRQRQGGRGQAGEAAMVFAQHAQPAAVQAARLEVALQVGRPGAERTAALLHLLQQPLARTVQRGLGDGEALVARILQEAHGVGRQPHVARRRAAPQVVGADGVAHAGQAADGASHLGFALGLGARLEAELLGRFFVDQHPRQGRADGLLGATIGIVEQAFDHAVDVDRRTVRDRHADRGGVRIVGRHPRRLRRVRFAGVQAQTAHLALGRVGRLHLQHRFAHDVDRLGAALPVHRQAHQAQAIRAGGAGGEAQRGALLVLERHGAGAVDDADRIQRLQLDRHLLVGAAQIGHVQRDGGLVARGDEARRVQLGHDRRRHHHFGVGAAVVVGGERDGHQAQRAVEVGQVQRDVGLALVVELDRTREQIDQLDLLGQALAVAAHGGIAAPLQLALGAVHLLDQLAVHVQQFGRVAVLAEEEVQRIGRAVLVDVEDADVDRRQRHHGLLALRAIDLHADRGLGLGFGLGGGAQLDVELAVGAGDRQERQAQRARRRHAVAFAAGAEHRRGHVQVMALPALVDRDFHLRAGRLHGHPGRPQHAVAFDGDQGLAVVRRRQGQLDAVARLGGHAFQLHLDAVGAVAHGVGVLGVPARVEAVAQGFAGLGIGDFQAVAAPLDRHRELAAVLQRDLARVQQFLGFGVAAVPAALVVEAPVVLAFLAVQAHLGLRQRRDLALRVHAQHFEGGRGAFARDIAVELRTHGDQLVGGPDAALDRAHHRAAARFQQAGRDPHLHRRMGAFGARFDLQLRGAGRIQRRFRQFLEMAAGIIVHVAENEAGPLLRQRVAVALDLEAGQQAVAGGRRAIQIVALHVDGQGVVRRQHILVGGQRHLHAFGQEFLDLELPGGIRRARSGIDAQFQHPGAGLGVRRQIDGAFDVALQVLGGLPQIGRDHAAVGALEGCCQRRRRHHAAVEVARQHRHVEGFTGAIEVAAGVDEQVVGAGDMPAGIEFGQVQRRFGQRQHGHFLVARGADDAGVGEAAVKAHVALAVGLGLGQHLAGAVHQFEQRAGDRLAALERHRVGLDAIAVAARVQADVADIKIGDLVFIAETAGLAHHRDVDAGFLQFLDAFDRQEGDVAAVRLVVRQEAALVDAGGQRIQAVQVPVADRALQAAVAGIAPIVFVVAAGFLFIRRGRAAADAQHRLEQFRHALGRDAQELHVDFGHVDGRHRQAAVLAGRQHHAAAGEIERRRHGVGHHVAVRAGGQRNLVALARQARAHRNRIRALRLDVGEIDHARIGADHPVALDDLALGRGVARLDGARLLAVGAALGVLVGFARGGARVGDLQELAQVGLGLDRLREGDRQRQRIVVLARLAIEHREGVGGADRGRGRQGIGLGGAARRGGRGRGRRRRSRLRRCGRGRLAALAHPPSHPDGAGHHDRASYRQPGLAVLSTHGKPPRLLECNAPLRRSCRPDNAARFSVRGSCFFATLYSRTPPVVAALFLRVQTGSITHCKGCWRARAYCATWAIRVAARSRG